MKMNTIFDHVKMLYECELYVECLRLSSLLISAYEQVRSILKPQEHYLTLMYHAESLYYEGRYRRAEGAYRQALLSKKVMSKSKSNFNKSTENLAEIFPDAEIKFKIAKCLYEIRKNDDAIQVLQSIPAKNRTPKMNFFLATLYRNNERSSTAAYKEVLKECPMSLEAIENLLAMGVKGAEVNSLVLDVTLLPQCSDWLGNWIKAHDLIFSRKYTQAIQTLCSIESNSVFRNSNMLLSLIGETYFIMGDYDNAMNYLNRSYMLYSTNSMGIQIYARILAVKEKLTDLERIITATSSAAEYTTEMWYIMAQYLYSLNKFDKAAYFSQKALSINPRNVEALMLKCRIYIDVKKHKEVIALLRLVQQMVPHRYEVYKMLVTVFMSLYRLRDAQSAANLGIKTIGQTPRTLVLLAQTYNSDMALKAKEKPLLLKALELDENYLPAVMILAELLQNEGDTTGAITLLKKQVTVHSNATMHSVLGNLLRSVKDQNGAFEHYTLALRLDPADRQAMAGLMAMGRSTNNTIENSYTTSSVTEEATELVSNILGIDELVPPPDPDPESESDAMWSDVEIEINNS